MEKGAECGKVSEKARDMCGTLKGILTGGDKSKTCEFSFAHVGKVETFSLSLPFEK